MRLVEARVRKFKSVTDSTEFELDEAVTALVGKNESGKTATLEALYRLKPLSTGHTTTFEELDDFPRRTLKTDRNIPSTRPIETKWELDDADVEAVDAMFGPGVVASRDLHAYRTYGSSRPIVSSPIWDMGAALKFVVAAAGLDTTKFTASTEADLVAALNNEGTEAATALLSQLADRDVESEVRNFIWNRVPSFQYFDEYNVLPGRVSIRRLQSVAEDSLRPDERTALALLRLAGVEQDEFTHETYEARKAVLEGAANRLTDELFEYWSQNTDLMIELDIEFEPDSNQPAAPEPFLQIRIRNMRHRMSLNIDRRSRGFIWFFSFLVAFSEYADEDRRVILLDEPGLNLHAKAQNDLLRYIDERLAPHHQVIYSTHSLFMIEPTKLERCRTVEDIDNVGTVVSEEVWDARPETVFPLLGALGVDMAQTLIIGADQLLVEGPADVVYLTIMSDVLRSAGRTPLDPRWTLTPAGGIEKIPTFISLLGGSDLNITVLIDVAGGGNQRIDNLVKRGLLDKKKLVPLTDITQTTEADIEDMFEEGWYLKLLDGSGVGKYAKTKLPKGTRIVKRVEAGRGERFDHFQPANFLLRKPGRLLDEIDDATKDRFDALFTRLNGLLS